MFVTLLNLNLLAQMADWRAMGNHFRPDSAAINIPHLFVLATVVLVIASLIWALSRWKESEHTSSLDNPQRLFADLCKAHELSSEKISLLRRVARELQVPHPARLFVDPSMLVSALQLQKFEPLEEDLKKLGEEFFGFHLWKQAVASDRSCT